MRAQGVSGVRIFVTFCGPGSSSQAFPNCGQPYTNISWNRQPNPPPGNDQYKWISNVGAFFQDVHDAGIANVTITIASSGLTYSLPKSSTASPKGPCPTYCCPDTPDPVYFNTTAPFGLQSTGWPIGDIYSPNATNDGYNCAPINSQYFLGWTNQFNVINAILAQARGRVNVYELELQQEMNPMVFTVLMRYIYDNSMPQSAGLQQGQKVNVLSNLRSLMSANGFDSNRVNYSAVEIDATTATDNCTNVYTDYSRNFELDSIASIIGAGYVGLNRDAVGINGLECGGSDTMSMLTPPFYSTQPDIVDVHIYPGVSGITNTDAQIQQVAALDYGDVPHFLTLVSLTSANIVVGETYGGTLSPLNLGPPNYYWCWLGANQTPSGAPNDNVAGFNNEGVSNPLSGFTVTFRPWMELEDPSGQCFAYGTGPGTSGDYQSVNYNGNGPYTPTNQ